MKIFRGFSTKSICRLSCLLCTIILLVPQICAVNVIENEEPEESQSADDVEHQERRNAVKGSTRLRTRNNSPALNHFLEDVLKARDELKWIDRAVHNSGSPRNIESSLSRRKSRNGKAREEYERSRGIYNENEMKPKREIDDARKSDSALSLASLKRTIIQLRDSLNPRAYDEPGIHKSDEITFHGKRKLLTSVDLKSAMDIAIAYYDYDDDGDSAGSPLSINHPMERDIKQNESSQSFPDSAGNPPMMKKDENLEEEKKEELMNENTKNKWPKEEFISDIARSDDDKQSPAENAQVLKRIADQDSESSDYSQWMLEKSRVSKNLGNEKSDISNDENSLILTNIDDEGEIDDPLLMKERTYLVISPSIAKITRKRSVNFMNDNDESKLSSKLLALDADKSAKNYAALKSTDDMFKGGSEQSNPLGEDKLVLEASSFSPSALSSSIGLPISSRSFKIKTTSSEWKVIEAIDEKNSMPKYSMRSDRGVGRHLTQINREILRNDSFVSSVTDSSTVKNYTNSSTSTFSTAIINLREEILSTTKNSDTEFHQQNIVPEISRDLTSTVSRPKKMFPPKYDEIYNNTRLRRHVSYDPEKMSKYRRHGGYRRRKSHQNLSGRKRQSANDDHQPRKLTVLLAADNIEDESQIDQAVHGELAGKIVERIFEQVQRNEGIKVALGPGLYRRHKSQESMALDKMYHKGLDENEVKETEAMMRRVMELLGRLVLDEVRRKTCATLAPDMHDFLQWTLGLDEFAPPSSDQIPPLPIIPGHDNHESTEKSPSLPDKFLFPNSTNDEPRPNDLTELERKVNLLKGLIKEYNALTEREKTKVQTVHDYLVRQLTLLMKYIESKEAAEQAGNPKSDQTAGSRIAYQPILQYQASLPESNFTKARGNLSNGSDMKIMKNQHAYSMLSPGSMVLPYLNDYSRSSERNSGHWTKRRKRTSGKFDFSERTRREIKNHRNDKETSLEYQKLLRQIASLRRKKRAYYRGYETPKIYIEPEETNVTTMSLVSPASTTIPTTKRYQEMSFVPESISVSSSLPVRGKNRLEDEILLLNKREAWKRENQRLLEEVAFGKDTRYDPISVKNQDSFDKNENRKKRADRGTTTNKTLEKNLQSSINGSSIDSRSDERSIEKTINVFPVETNNT